MKQEALAASAEEARARKRRPGGGRKRKRPDYDAGRNLEELMDGAAELYDAGQSLQAIADELALNPIKVRKLLITAEVYESEIAEEVRATFEVYRARQDYRAAVQATAAELRLSIPSVNSYLPYEKGVYFAATDSVNSTAKQVPEFLQSTGYQDPEGKPWYLLSPDKVPEAARKLAEDSLLDITKIVGGFLVVDNLDPVIAVYTKDYNIARKMSALEEKRQSLMVDVDDAKYAKKTAEEAGKAPKEGQLQKAEDRLKRCDDQIAAHARRNTPQKDEIANIIEHFIEAERMPQIHANGFENVLRI